MGSRGVKRGKTEFNGVKQELNAAKRNQPGLNFLFYSKYSETSIMI